MVKIVKRRENKHAGQSKAELLPTKPESSAVPAVEPHSQILPKPINPDEKRLRWATLHTEFLSALGYRALTASLTTNEFFLEYTDKALFNFVQEAAPRDPLEKLAIIQALLTHTRHVKLAQLAVNQTTVETLKVINESCDRAANTFRRLMLAIDEHRRPASSEPVVSIRQANIAQQQVVQNVEKVVVRKKK